MRNPISLSYRVVDVFTETRFGGNPLAVVLEADALSTDQMQVIAREFGFSETSFVLAPKDPAHDARVRIFTPTVEMPFAGHPNVGTAYVLASERDPIPKAMVFEELAGLVDVVIEETDSAVTGTVIRAPEPLSQGSEISAEAAAAALSLDPSEITTDRHLPQIASVGAPFLFVELTARDALRRARPNASALKDALAGIPSSPDAVYAYTRDIGPSDGAVDWTARMFAPEDGIAEDPATGSATGALGALFHRLGTAPRLGARYLAAQGVDMGRPSLLRIKANDEITEIGGATVSVMSGVLTV